MEDIFGVILSNIDAGSTFKSSRLVCRLWLKVTKKLFPRGHLKFANHIQTIVEKVLEYNKHAEKPIEIHGGDPINEFNLGVHSKTSGDQLGYAEFRSIRKCDRREC